MRRKLSGSVTVESAFVIPLVLAVFGVVLTLLFYYHDKALLLSATQETATYASNREEKSEKKIREHMKSLVEGRMLLLGEPAVEVDVEERGIRISCSAKAGTLSLKVDGYMARTNPEDYIRMFRKLEKLEEEVKEQREELYEE